MAVNQKAVKVLNKVLEAGFTDEKAIAAMTMDDILSMQGINLNGTADVKATFTAEGRKKNCIIKLEEIEKISSVHREKNEDNAHFIKNPHIFTYLHRQQSIRNNLKLYKSM